MPADLACTKQCRHWTRRHQGHWLQVVKERRVLRKDIPWEPNGGNTAVLFLLYRQSCSPGDTSPSPRIGTSGKVSLRAPNPATPAEQRRPLGGDRASSCRAQAPLGGNPAPPSALPGALAREGASSAAPRGRAPPAGRGPGAFPFPFSPSSSSSSFPLLHHRERSGSERGVALKPWGN